MASVATNLPLVIRLKSEQLGPRNSRLSESRQVPNFRLTVVEVGEDLGVETLVSEAALERFDEAAFLGFVGCSEVEPHTS